MKTHIPVAFVILAQPPANKKASGMSAVHYFTDSNGETLKSRNDENIHEIPDGSLQNAQLTRKHTGMFICSRLSHLASALSKHVERRQTGRQAVGGEDSGYLILGVTGPRAPRASVSWFWFMGRSGAKHMARVILQTDPRPVYRAGRYDCYGLRNHNLLMSTGLDNTEKLWYWKEKNQPRLQMWKKNQHKFQPGVSEPDYSNKTRRI